MLTSKKFLRRSLYLDPCRNHNASFIKDSRLFSHNAQLLLTSHPAFRPQLPFLYSSSPQLLRNRRYQIQLSRLLTTETRESIKDNAKLTARTLYWMTVVFSLIAIIQFGVDQEITERTHTAPPVYSFYSKIRYRIAKGAENPGEAELVDWQKSGESWETLIGRLEDPNVDGANIRSQLADGESHYLKGVGSDGFDISGKSEPWRRGYHEALMGAARAAEHLDTWVKDTTRDIVFPPEVVLGPSNPRPRPVGYRSPSAPKEENCVPAFEEPHAFYIKLLTTTGFTARQRLEAAIAYADWLSYKGSQNSAEDMYSWAFDIARGNMSSHDEIVDRKTGVISRNARGVSTNVLLAANAYAAHKAQKGELAAALPIYLSILRAQQSLPPPDPVSMASDRPARTPTTFWESIVYLVLNPPSYPLAPPSGEEPATRTPASVCLEAGIMTHIGEILWASSLAPSSANPDASPEHTAGLSWTRDGLELAEATFRSLPSLQSVNPMFQGVFPRQQHRQPRDSPMEKDARTRCSECMEMGMKNWRKMIGRLRVAEIEAEVKADLGEKSSIKRCISSWFWGANGKRNSAKDDEKGIRKWDVEPKAIEAKQIELRRLMRQEGLVS